MPWIDMAELIIITGGAKSGKSTWALNLSRQQNYTTRHFIATALPVDEEMQLCIEKHRQERGHDFQTCEEPYELGEALQQYLKPANQVVLIDCLTVWLGNLFHKYGTCEEKIEQAINTLIENTDIHRQRAGGALIIITNELGSGIVPPDAATRLYRNKAGQLNQKLAHLADKVYLCVAGIPLLIKNQKGIEQSPWLIP
jgi:adenosylcobinamide kinase/adenosylcobinamide-phosphate guanylyltransferase